SRTRPAPAHAGRRRLDAACHRLPALRRWPRMSQLPEGTRRRLMKHPLGWIAAGFGAGFSPKAPGTVGSIAALLPWWFLMKDLPLPAYLAVVAAGFALGWWAAHWVIHDTK